MSTFKLFTGQVNYPELEHRILEFWKQNRIFEKLQEQLKAAPLWSFFDGPITANNPMGVHHAWGRSYKDIFCRYKAMCGFNQRWQNGFDCQGLWVEVEVERQLGLNSKREIEAFGLERFSLECRKRVETFAERITQQSIRLGQWMRWYDENSKPTSYFTFDDNNIEHIWYFLKKCDELGWLYIGHRSMPWCWRCGTSLSQHELVDSYEDRMDPSVFFKCPIIERPGESFLVWTTTPWTLTSNTALAIQPALPYVKAEVGGDMVYVAESRADAVLPPDARRLGTVQGSELLGLTYRGPLDDLPAQANVKRRTIPWETISEEEGTGIVHIAPGCGAEDFELGKLHDLDVLVPIDENGYFVENFGCLQGKHVTESATLIHQSLREKGVLFRWEDYTHRYPICWRCKTPLVFRLVDEWFIRCDEIRPRMKREAARVRCTPPYGQALMQNWLDSMGDWCISRKRFFGLPLPFYLCSCGKRRIIGSRAELRERAANPASVEALPELHRPWIDDIKIRCECGKEVSRVPEVGDCWLDAGIVPFSTLNYLPDHLKIPGATRSIRNLPGSDDQWRDWYPADWISEMREQIRLWFYSMLFMSVTLEDRAPYQSVLTYEEMRNEDGEPFSKSGGNAIPFEDAAEKMGADPMRWLFAGAPLSQIFRFGYGPANEVKRKLLTLWNCYGFFAMYANLQDSPSVKSIEGRVPGDEKVGRADSGIEGRTELDRWILAQLNALVRDCCEALDSFDAARVTREVEKFIDDLSNWYIRQSRRRVWKSGDDTDKCNALQTLYEVLVTLAKLIAPVLPFTAEELYQTLVRPIDKQAPESVHHCRYPHADLPLIDEQLVTDINDVRRIVNLAHAARTAARIKVRQPLAGALIALERNDAESWLQRFRENIQNEINVKCVELLSTSDPVYEQIKNCNTPEPFVGSFDSGYAVALDTSMTDELRYEGIAREFIRRVQNMRKDAQLNVSDRIETYYASDCLIERAIERHAEFVKTETLSIRLERAEAKDFPSNAFTAEFKISGHPVTVAIRRAEG